MKLIKRAKKGMDYSVFLLVLTAGLFYWTHTSAQEPSEIDNYLVKEWVVSEGESLWLIASQHTKESDMSIEQIVYWMKQKNELTTSQFIYPGQELLIPIELEAYAVE